MPSKPLRSVGVESVDCEDCLRLKRRDLHGPLRRECVDAGIERSGGDLAYLKGESIKLVDRFQNTIKFDLVSVLVLCRLVRA